MPTVPIPLRPTDRPLASVRATLPPAALAGSLVLHAFLLLPALIWRPAEPEPEGPVPVAVSIVWSRLPPPLVSVTEPPAPVLRASAAGQGAAEVAVRPPEPLAALGTPMLAAVESIEPSAPIEPPLPIEPPARSPLLATLAPPTPGPFVQPVVQSDAVAAVAARVAEAPAAALPEVRPVVAAMQTVSEIPAREVTPLAAGEVEAARSVVPGTIVEALAPAQAPAAKLPPQDIAAVSASAVVGTAAEAAPIAAPPEAVVTMLAPVSPPEAMRAERRSDATSAHAASQAEIAVALAKVACAGVAGVHDPSTGILRLSGHVQQEADRDLLRRLTSTISGVVDVDASALMLVPPPHCHTLALLRALDLSPSQDQPAAASVTPVAFHSSDSAGAGGALRTIAFGAGQSVKLQVEAPDFPAFLHVDYFDRDGHVIHLRPNSLIGASRVPAAQIVTIGEGDGLDIRVAPPFGLDLVVVIATSRPLFKTIRPLQERASDYLAELRRTIVGARADDGFQAEYAWLSVRTHP